MHNGSVEIICTGAQCNLSCRDLEGIEVLQQSTFYSVGQTCSITISDGVLLSEAMETVLAFLSTGPIPGGGGQPTTPPGLENSENPNQPDVPPQSCLAPGLCAPPGQGN